MDDANEADEEAITTTTTTGGAKKADVDDLWASMNAESSGRGGARKGNHAPAPAAPAPAPAPAASKVDDLWVDWHPGGRISWSKERLPTKDDEMHKVYKWMLNSVDNAAKHATGQSDSESHCKTVMYTVGQ